MRQHWGSTLMPTYTGTGRDRSRARPRPIACPFSPMPSPTRTNPSYRGLAASRVGLVVLSTDFISKGWANYELDGIVTRTLSGDQILLPIWHNITKQQVIDFSPSLADKVARSTATHTVDEIAKEIADLLNNAN